ncbi:MAG: hypothetical protein A3D96_06400 [Chlamydiae bacterium RIFCSPHIGHO2_12_FULL_44_59]|nr:MAG: hypothetical protein A2796_06525 [Chlamydiae bacterium RIFCSPHIGHO2_01_FULL_44_39]OGN57248.1 MAG: hypothetical protein A3C42_01190 [Chlamydiae bacterium RIFCSPHIGHO2_02_FULL_45_9]OGN59651.1 MAG: hypothetical protein A3D96_06400 [Chlamydiae bacterium RIFCSPHIGHO2_12_FULL_44_59]OGN65741.1 MAG: hypothetical protein A2978_07395 [Chlamydiae bacterium RIFCSPLOWO2_01_FULL_44_52]OGN67883.1 MAG: hypothetical protein A3I67_05875 [Chlamydiae bacterium RIFCSPLOWO2_02_FULL_45_22]OGN69374.1 MAG: hyp
MWFWLSLKNLFRNPRRTFAILITIAIGTGALFAFDGFINGVLKELKYDTIHSNYGYGQIHPLGYREMVYEKPMDHWMGNGEELEAYLYSVAGVENVFPRVSFSALLKSNHTTIGGSGQGVHAEREAEFFHSLNVEEGEMLRSQPSGILLGKGLANALQVKPGDSVKVTATSNKGYLKNGNFIVTGIFHTGSSDFDGRVFRIQLPEAQKLLKTSKIEHVSLGLRSDADWPAVATSLHTAFPHLEATPFDVLDKIYYQNSVNWLKAQFAVVQVIILSIVLLGIFNSISSSILERKQEIGNLRANGESRVEIMRMILTEGGLIAFVGSLLGLLGAYTILTFFVHNGLMMPPGPGQTKEFVVTFSFEWPMVLVSLALSMLAALIASYFASFKVARLSIASALRAL